MTERKPQTQDKFIVRLPDGMRDRIKAAADANGRSMNAEVVATLEEAYPAPVSLDDIVARFESEFRGFVESKYVHRESLALHKEHLQSFLDQIDADASD
ncbi:Arc family DNA-binding protein [Mangrovicoccus ximenensis]|uniref:Arc family DNA-binding protein n=1 Tax=Mangrovicoccus ximenensis TaxID=1911570 RepID=UPI000D3DB8C2|nr:Arc family DNA-binding protein [Mangrovicoccus ximenensis]